ncbi:putative bacteriophage protein [Escherichia coli TA054]|uniref:DUF551 domain-containing protein n=1 Tax=Escherichia coli TaxID=562 RepID=UPI000A186278|nr:DUF551 domain-containing protein [Escherichia coli]OSL74050.1 putative bacteriophage protein [Escherichia coli TA054]
MAYAFHHALSDSSLGADEVEEIKTGLRAAFANVAVQPALIVPAEIEPDDSNTFDYVDGWNACRAAMLQSQREGNPHVTPARLPGGFTIEDAKELHEDLVRSHISQALSGEKMKKKDRDADLRWIHGVIVQAAWFVKASLEQNALTGDSPGTPAGWISCSDAVPAEYCDVILRDALGNVFPGSWDKVFCPTRGGNKMAFVDQDGVEVEDSTHWMPLPEPPQEEKSGNADCSDTSGKTDNPQASGNRLTN